jgi:Zn-dependent protease with chaperone function
VTYALAGLVIAVIGAPHVLRLESAAPGLAAFIWLAALALRGLAAVFCAIFVVLFLPTTQLFSLITHWCWHAVVPYVAAHLPLDGHALGDLALLMPAFVLAVSVLWVLVGLWRAASRVRLLLRRAVVGPGPQESLVLADGEVLVAAAGLRRPRVVVSAGALVAFDEEELAASLEHERGHIARRHRYLLVSAELCRALGRFLPGTRTAARELLFHVERDADRYAIARRHDPAVLASAICKAAQGPAVAVPAMSLGGNGVVTRRTRLLLESETPARSRRERSLRALATAMVALVLVSVAALPSAAHAGYHQAADARGVQHCAT